MITIGATITTNSVADPSVGWSFSHTVDSGNDRVLLVGIAFFNGNNRASAVTYGGVSMTRIVTRSNGNGTGIDIWRLINPATGSATIVITSTETQTATAMCLNFYGVNQTTPEDVTGSNFGNDSSPSVNITTTKANTLVVDFVRTTAAIGAVGANQTVRAGGNPNQYACSTEEAASAGAVTMSWGGTVLWTSCVVALAPLLVGGHQNVLLKNIG